MFSELQTYRLHSTVFFCGRIPVSVSITRLTKTTLFLWGFFNPLEIGTVHTLHNIHGGERRIISKASCTVA